MPAVCQWCGQPLRWEEGKGWVHPDGNMYVRRKQRVWYTPGLRTRDPEVARAWVEAGLEVQEDTVEVDDHCALPARERTDQEEVGT